MPALSIQPPFPVFADTDGQPLENGYILIGVANLDPQGNPLAVYWDAALTIPAPQPIRTTGGYPSRSGTPANLYANADYSIRVLDKNGNLVYSANSVQQIISSGDVTFTQTGSTVERTVSQKLSDVYTFQDFGALGNNIDDDTLEMQAAIDYVASLGGGTLMGKPGSIYKITAALVIKTGVRIDLAGATITQYANNTQIITAPSANSVYNWAIENGSLTYNTWQDGTSTIGVTVSGTLNAGDVFQGQTSGAYGRVINVVSGVLTYLAGQGTLVSGETLSTNATAQATTTSVPTAVRLGTGIRLADGAFSFQFRIRDLNVVDAFDGLVCPSTTGSFAFVGEVTNFFGHSTRWHINYDCDSFNGSNTNVVFTNCWTNNSFRNVTAPFAAGFRFVGGSQFRWNSLLADSINAPFLDIANSTGEIGTLSLEASIVTGYANNFTAPIQISDSDVSLGAARFIGNTFSTFASMTVTITGSIAVGNTITGATSGAAGVVVSVAGTRVIFTQNTSQASFLNGENVQVGGVTQGSVSAVPIQSGEIYMVRAASNVPNRQFSLNLDNFITSNNAYAGQNIYEVAATANGLSTGPFLVNNTAANLDRLGITLNITGTVAVGNVVVGASSGATGTVVSVGTFLVQIKPASAIPWTIGENVQVGGVTQATVLATPPYPGLLADFATPPSVRVWSGVFRWIDASGTSVSGVRIRGDLSSAIVADRLMVQSGALNGSSDLAVIPNGTSTTAALTVASNSNPTNASTGQLIASASAVTVAASRNGTGTFLPLQLRVNAADVRVQVDTSGSVRAGAPSLATSATDGFLYVPTCAGTPTGVPTVVTGYAPIVVNTTNNKLYFYSGGSWRDAGP